MVEERGQTVSDLGEMALVDRLRARLAPPPATEVWSGDDAAVVAVPGERLVSTIDTLVENLDFDRSFSSGSDVGFKVVAVNVSDVAAMGARPSHALTALIVPPSTPVSWVDDLIEGMSEAAGIWDVKLVGGDLSGGSEISVSIAMIGTGVAEPVLRSGARPGDAICVTGRLGGAAGGLAGLRAGRTRTDAVARLAQRHLRPRARLDEAVALAALPPTAMIDLSDGLAVDLWRIMEASGVGCDVDPGAIPVDPDLDAVADLIDPLEAALSGGDDYELLLTIEEPVFDRARSALAGLGTELSRIGDVTEGPRRVAGRSLDEWRSKAWEHLQDG